MLQVLDAEGPASSPDPSPAERAHLEALTPPHLVEMYRAMVRTRTFDAEATALQRRGELGLWVSCLGQEAAQVGSAAALGPQDYAFPSYREHGVAAVRGVEFADILRLFRGVDHGGWDTEGHRCHTYTLVVGAQSLHGVGYALGMALDDVGEAAAVIVYLGDGAMAQGDVHEAMVFAASYRAPIVFFVQNNGWAISTPTHLHTRVPFAQRGDGLGIPGRRVDGNDALACYAATAAALGRARAGEGPAIVEAVTYRMGAHTTADDPTRYREAAEEAAWAARDPIDRLARHLRAAGLLDDPLAERIRADAQAEATRVRETCLAMTAPGLETFLRRAYAGPHQQVSDDLAARAPIPSGAR
jgi:pyruvate dehydrogenase E1 component alpha subunit